MWRARFLCAAVVVGLSTIAFGVPAPNADAAGGPVTQIVVWGDSMTQVWPSYLQTLVGIPVIQMGTGDEPIQQTQQRFDAWVDANPVAAQTTGHLCWCGHVNANRQNHDWNSILPTMGAMAARVPAGLFMPIGLTNGPDQPAGSLAYNIVVQGVNIDLAAAFGPSYAEVRRYLVTDGLAVAGLPATPEDQRNIADDVPPASLRTDMPRGNPAHLNDAGRHVTAERLNDLVRVAGWVAGSVAGATTATTLQSSANPAVQGSREQFTATVSNTSSEVGLPSGTIQFQIDRRLAGPPVLLAGGVARSRPIVLSPGDHLITATYSGDAVFTTSFTQITETITVSPGR